MTDVEPCAQCGQRHLTHWNTPACTGHLSTRNPRNPGGPCTHSPLAGLNICDKHGANLQARAAGRRRVAETTAQASIAKLVPDNPEPVRDPIAVLARLAGEANAVRAAAATLIRDSELETVGDLEQIQGLAMWFERWHDRTVRACEALVKSNYIERHAAVEEAQALALLAQVQRGTNLIPDVTLRQAVVNEIAAGIRELQTPA